MVYDVESRMQRKLFYGIVDEVDSILIDEARTPLIISGPAEDHAELYVKMNAVAPLLQADGARAEVRRARCPGRLLGGPEGAPGSPVGIGS